MTDSLTERYPNLRTPGFEGEASEKIIRGALAAREASPADKKEKVDKLRSVASQTTYLIDVYRYPSKSTSRVQYRLVPIGVKGSSFGPLPIDLYNDEFKH